MAQESGPAPDEGRAEAPPRPTVLGRTIPQLVAQAVAAILLIVFILQNLDKVEVDFIFWTVTSRLAWALLAAAGLGFAVGFFRFRIGVRHRR